ncbi:MAG: T9SS type A sorting domain-containing protein [Opitutaceae bacterium]
MAILWNSCKNNTAGNTFNLSNSYVREWDESSIGFFDAWVLAGDGSTTLYKNSGSTLDQNHGYELVQQSPTTYTFSGELLDTDFTQSLPYTSGVAFAGQHIFGNPFTAAINIADIQFGLTNTEKAVYLYNTGTFTDWSNAGGFSDPGNGPGQYTVSTPLTAGSGSVPSQIPTSGSFLVKSFGGTGSITIPKAGGLVANIDQQRIKKQNLSSALKVNTRIDLIGQKFSDRMWIFTDASCSRNFDNGWDGRKILGSSQVSQLYSIENDGNYQINAVNDMNESYIGFQAGEDTQFKMVFNHENTDKIYGKIYLVDLLANKTIDITQNGTEYAFTANANDATKRFKIITQTTGTLNPTESSSKLKMFNTSEAIYIQNFTEKTATYMLYNASGKAIQTINVDPNSMITVNTNSLNSGIYIAKSETETEKATLRLIIR